MMVVMMMILYVLILNTVLTDYKQICIFIHKNEEKINIQNAYPYYKVHKTEIEYQLHTVMTSDLHNALQTLMFFQLCSNTASFMGITAP